MFKEFDIYDKIIKVEFVFHKDINDFLARNNLSTEILLQNDKWEDYIYDIFRDEAINITIKDLEKAKIVIYYIEFNKKNKIKIDDKQFMNGTRITGFLCNKNTLFKEFYIGFSIYTE